jgi:hypothetical protein
MSTAEKPTHADDCSRLLRILADAPVEGLSLDEIQAVTERTGEKWSLRTVNDVMCSIRAQVAHEKVRVRGQGKVTKYRLKLTRS